MGHALMAWAHAAAVTAWDRRGAQRGQGTVEYVGVVVMVTLLVAGLAVASKGWAPDVGSGLKKGLVDAIKRLNESFS